MRFAEIGGVVVWRVCAVGALLAAGTAEAKNAEEAVSEPKRRGGVSPDLVDEE